MTLYKFDLRTGRYLGPVIVGDDPPVTAQVLGSEFVADAPPEWYKNPAWDRVEAVWVDRPDQGIVIPVMESPSRIVSIEERLAAVEAATLDMLLGGGLL
jgi:hypothetical protein